VAVVRNVLRRRFSVAAETFSDGGCGGGGGGGGGGSGALRRPSDREATSGGAGAGEPGACAGCGTRCGDRGRGGKGSSAGHDSPSAAAADELVHPMQPQRPQPRRRGPNLAHAQSVIPRARTRRRPHLRSHSSAYGRPQPGARRRRARADTVGGCGVLGGWARRRRAWPRLPRRGSVGRRGAVRQRRRRGACASCSSHALRCASAAPAVCASV
jgi:hypothetical protein